MTQPSLVIFVVALLLALPYLGLSHRAPGWGRSLIKTLPVTLFALAAILAQAPPFLSAALLLSALGDLALSRPGKRAFLYGLVAFALGHVLFMLLFIWRAGQPLWEAFTNAPVAALAMVLIAVSTELWLIPHTGRLRWPVRAYILLIGLMLLAALNLPPQLWLVTTGAAAFVLSDLLLSLRLFRLPEPSNLRRPVGWAVWTLYIAAQALMVWGMLAV